MSNYYSQLLSNKTAHEHSYKHNTSPSLKSNKHSDYLITLTICEYNLIAASHLGPLVRQSTITR